MPKFRVKKYDTYIEFYPDSNVPKKSYPEGSIVEIDDISKCNQAHKLEKVSDEVQTSDESVNSESEDDLFMDPLEMNAGTKKQGEVELPTSVSQVSEADRKRAADKLRKAQGQNT